MKKSTLNKKFGAATNCILSYTTGSFLKKHGYEPSQKGHDTYIAWLQKQPLDTQVFMAKIKKLSDNQ